MEKDKNERTDETIPKPMVEISDSPVLQHLIDIFENFNNFDYQYAGYKSEIIEKHFSNANNIKTIQTGEETNTGGERGN